MASPQLSYLKTAVPLQLSKLKEDTPAQWGIMTPQHMVEHVSSLVYISLGKREVPLFIPEEKIARAQEWLMSDQSFKRNIRIPLFPEKETLPLRFSSLDEAKAKLSATLLAFFQHYEENPLATAIHPAFGTLDKTQWEQFHYKHFQHHFAQFALEAIFQDNSSDLP